MTKDLNYSLGDAENPPDPPDAPTWYETTEAWAWGNGWTAGYAAASSRTDNMECQTCGGKGTIGFPDGYDDPCPECSPPDNVECPYCKANRDAPISAIGYVCPAACGSTPENVETSSGDFQ